MCDIAQRQRISPNGERQNEAEDQDGNRECETEIAIREGGDVVAQARRVMIRPGVNEIDLRPSENYRFRGREHCFNVQVDLEGSKRDVDAATRFCAQQKPAWSRREQSDRNRSSR